MLWQFLVYRTLKKSLLRLQNTKSAPLQVEANTCEGFDYLIQTHTIFAILIKITHNKLEINPYTQELFP